MLNIKLKYRLLLAALIFMSMSSSGAFARDGDDHGRYREGNRGHEREENRGYNRGRNHEYRHYYREGKWYRHGWLGFDVLVSAIFIGAMIESLPPEHSTIIVKGIPYYYGDNHYYRQASEGGYVVVSPPVLEPPPAQAPDTITINIPNSRGSFTPVVLRRAGYGYLGPQGEYYANSPTVDQLKALYGN